MIIYFKGVTYDIPIQKNYNITRSIDSSFDSGVVIARLSGDYGDLDISKRIPRDLTVELEDYTFRTGETHMKQIRFGDNPVYEHTINLVSMSKLFTKIPLENIAVTQPQGDLGTYNRSVNVIDPTQKDRLDNYYSNPPEAYASASVYEIYNNTTIPFANIIQTNASKIEGVEIIETGKAYTVSLSINLYYLDLFQDTENYSFELKYGSTVAETDTFDLVKRDSNNVTIYKKTFTFDITPSSSSTFSLVFDNDQFVFLNVASLSITGKERVGLPERSYAQTIDKILRHQPYTLNAYSRNKLNLTAPEDKYENYTIYDALNKIGTQNGAILRVYDEILERYWQSTATTGTYIEASSVYDVSPYSKDLGTVIKIGDSYYKNVEGTNYVREIGYDFFDDPSTVDMPYNSYDEVAELEDYVAGIQSSAKNVLKPLRYSPFKGGFKGVRSSDIGQQTTSNILYECEDEIERPIKVLVKGLASQNSDASITYSESDETDITSRVVNNLYYQTLSNEKDVSYSGKLSLRKHNTLYYTQGSRNIEGFSYLGEDLDQVIGNPNVIRAWVETILAVRSEENGELITRNGTQSQDDEGLDGDIKLRLQVTYQNITETSARVFKDDLSGFEHETIKYINESANINESKALGDYLQLVVNRLGGTKTIISGVVDSKDELPQLGDIDSQGKVYTVIKTTHGDRIKYEMTLVQDYNVISSYIGIKSRLRFEEVSSSDSTKRFIRYPSKFIFTESQETFSTRIIDSENILASLFTDSTQGVNYAYIEFNHENGDTAKVHASVDSYAIGKSIELQITMKDNYSAGLQRYMEVISSSDVYMNRDVSYTDLYGKVNDIAMYVYYDNTAFTTAEEEAYPEASSNKGNDLFTVITDYIDKDAREQPAFLIEIALLSEDPQMRVFNGFARYNKIVEGDDSIRTGLLLYEPRPNAKLVDLSRVVDMTVSGTYEFGKMDFSWTASQSGVGIVWYDTNTLELVLAYLNDIPAGAGSETKYYKIIDSQYGGGYNIVVQIYKTYNITSNKSISNVQPFSKTSKIKYTTTVQEGEDYNVEIYNTYQFKSNKSISNVSSISKTGKIKYTSYCDKQFNGVEWVSGGTSPSGSPTCSSVSDVGNVRCVSACVFDEVFTYLSTTDETTTLPPKCSDGAEKTICVFNGSNWLCTVYEGVETYVNCETCEVVL